MPSGNRKVLYQDAQETSSLPAVGVEQEDLIKKEGTDLWVVKHVTIVITVLHVLVGKIHQRRTIMGMTTHEEGKPIAIIIWRGEVQPNLQDEFKELEVNFATQVGHNTIKCIHKIVIHLSIWIIDELE